jgi:DNA-binding CsgD family transcriptional regulator
MPGMSARALAGGRPPLQGEAGVFDLIIDDGKWAAPAVTGAIESDIETLLQRLAHKLSESSYEGERKSQKHDGEVHVLLDTEIGDLRFVAMRRARPSPISLLSPRELEIARMVASGYPNKTIASVLEISSWTVASHLRRIFVKLHVSCRAAMATRLSALALDGAPPPTAEPCAPCMSHGSHEDPHRRQ